MRGRRGERGSGLSVLVARHDDDDEYICIYNIYNVYIFMHVFIYMYVYVCVYILYIRIVCSIGELLLIYMSGFYRICLSIGAVFCPL